MPVKKKQQTSSNYIPEPTPVECEMDPCQWYDEWLYAYIGFINRIISLTINEGLHLNPLLAYDGSDSFQDDTIAKVRRVIYECSSKAILQDSIQQHDVWFDPDIEMDRTFKVVPSSQLYCDDGGNYIERMVTLYDRLREYVNPDDGMYVRAGPCEDVESIPLLEYFQHDDLKKIINLLRYNK